jgi:hypothetical protein
MPDGLFIWGSGNEAKKGVTVMHALMNSEFSLPFVERTGACVQILSRCVFGCLYHLVNTWCTTFMDDSRFWGSSNLFRYYSPWFHIRSHLGQQHGHQIQFWLLFSIKIFIGKFYMYILMKVIFKTNLFIWFSHIQTQRLKSYSWFIFPCLTQTLSKRLLIGNRRE